MLKKFNYNLNHSYVGAMWGLTLVMLLCIVFTLIFPGETLVPKSQLIIMLLEFSTIFNLFGSSLILFKGEIQPVNVTYVCPTARKYMREQEIKEIEKGE